MLAQLNRGESRHRLARNCFHGQRGEFPAAVTARVKKINSRIESRSHVSVLRNNSAYGCSAEVVGRLSPLADKHFNVFGRYHFTVTDSILMGGLRPLRDPDAPEELLWAAE